MPLLCPGTTGPVAGRPAAVSAQRRGAVSSAIAVTTVQSKTLPGTDGGSLSPPIWRAPPLPFGACDRLQRVSETGLHRAGNLRNRIQERAVIKRESLWHSTLFVCLFVRFLLFLTFARPSPPPAPTSHLRCCPGARRGKFWKSRTKGAGSAQPPARAAAAPARPAALRFLAAESRLPSCLPPRKKAPLGKERNKLSVDANRAAAGSAPGRAAAPRRLRAPPAPARPRRGQQVVKSSRVRIPPYPTAPRVLGREGNWETSVSLRIPVPPKEAQAVIPLKLSYFLYIYIHIKIFMRYIYCCIIYRTRLTTMIPSTA